MALQSLGAGRSEIVGPHMSDGIVEEHFGGSSADVRSALAGVARSGESSARTQWPKLQRVDMTPKVSVHYKQ